MPTTKAAVSIERSLFHRAECAAREMNVSRSELFSRALGEYLERREANDLLQSWNEAYADGLSPEEEDTIQDIQASAWGSLGNEEW